MTFVTNSKSALRRLSFHQRGLHHNALLNGCNFQEPTTSQSHEPVLLFSINFCRMDGLLILLASSSFLLKRSYSSPGQRSCYSPLGKSKPICWKGCSQSVSPGHHMLHNTTAVHVSGSTACRIRDVRFPLLRIPPIESSE